MNLRILIFIILITCILSLSIYKIYEYRQINSLISTINVTIPEEIKLASEEASLSHTSAKDFADQFFVEKSKEDLDSLDKDDIAIDNVQKSFKIYKNKNEEYHDLLHKDSLIFAKLKQDGRFLIGSRRDWYSHLVDGLLSNYKADQSVELNDKTVKAMITQLLTLEKGMVAYKRNLLTIDTKNTASISESFNLISSLEIYTEQNYAYEGEELVKTSLPYGYDVLNRYREFLKSYYLMSRDMVNGDYESAVYKGSKFITDSTSLTVDWKRFYGQDEQVNQDLRKQQINNSVEVSSMLKEFFDKKYGLYPLISPIKLTALNLYLCDMYSNKTDIFYDVKSELPKSSTFDNLLSDLDTVAPRTTDLDKIFDKGSVVFTNSESELDFTCKDSAVSSSYTFIHYK